MSNSDLAAIEAKVKEVLVGHPRVRAKVEEDYEAPPGYNGILVQLWYSHRTGRDDAREVEDTSHIPRIRRWKVSEANTLGNIMGEVEAAFPQFDVRFDGVHVGTFWYFFDAK